MSVLQLLQIPLESVPSVVQQPWLDLVTKLASANGVIATYVGTQHENNKVGGLAAGKDHLFYFIVIQIFKG